MSGPHKKGGHEEGGGHAPMWIVSFADMVILLMSFFVLMLVKGEQKTTSNEDMLKVLASVKLGFGYVPKPNSKDPIDLAVFQVMAQKNSNKFPKHGQRWLGAAIEGNAKKAPEPFVKAQSNIGKPIRFDRNSDVVAKSMASALDQIAEVIRHHYRVILVQGHCSPEEAARDGMQGHDLSFRRAVADKHALQSRGVAAARMRITSCANHESPKNLKANSRQLVVVTIGEYLLPSENEILEDELPSLDTKPAKKDGSHGGH